MTDFIYSLPPGTIGGAIFLAVTIILILLAVSPKWGCGGMLGAIVAGFLFLTDNGLVAIGGAIVIGIVWVMSQSSGNRVNINIEGDGNNNIWVGGK